MTKKTFRLVLLANLFLAPPLWAETFAPLVQYQGFLAATDGTPQQGPKRLEFNLYDAADATTPIWGPQVYESVAIISGRYSVILGSTDNTGRALNNLPDAGDKFLGVLVDGKEIQPRQLLRTVASNEPAKLADPNQSAASTVPPGTIVAYRSDRIPEGWLLCDGSLVPAGPQYEKLRGVIGGNLPDLRGLFLRGLGQNSNAAFRYPGDATRTLFEFQQDEYKSHAHRFDDYTFSENSGVPGKAWGSAGHSDIDNSPGSPFAHDTASVGGDETRPKNAGVYWMIKY